MKKIIQTLVFLSLLPVLAKAQAQDDPVLAALGGPGTVQPNQNSNELPDEPQQADVPARFRYLGSLECANCHVSPQTKYRLEGVEKFLRLSEYHTWLNKDPHARAYFNIIPDRQHLEDVTRELQNLANAVNQTARDVDINSRSFQVPKWEGSSNERSMKILTRVCECSTDEVSQLFQAMTNQPDFLVRIERTGNTNKLTRTVKQCMSCHAGWDNRQPEFDVEVVKYGTGVSCEGCHGPSSEWLADHSHSDWRKLSPQLKQEKFGLVNTRNPVARAQQCFSCHVGDVEQGKIITHAMYAAGHPPLPSIEIESFSDQMPRHWRYLTEKNDDFKFASEFKQRFASDLGVVNDLSQLNDDFPRTKNLLVGGMMAAAQSVTLMAESAGEFVNPGNAAMIANLADDKPWPEFAVYDCAGCHHNLKSGGTERKFAGVPGRPSAPYWPQALSKTGLAYLSVRQQGDVVEQCMAMQKNLQEVLDRQPFGIPEQLQKVGSKQAESLIEVARQIQGRLLTRDDAIFVLQLLCGSYENNIFQPADETWDFHSARQLAWAINLVYSEIAQPKIPGQPQLSGEFAGPDNEIANILSELREYMMLDLAGAGKITSEQDRFLTTWRDFDRKKFLLLIGRLRESFKNSQLPFGTPPTSNVQHQSP